MLLNPAFKISAEDARAFQCVMQLVEQSGPTEENRLLLRRVRECVRECTGGANDSVPWDLLHPPDDDQAANLISDCLNRIRRPGLRRLAHPMASAVGECAGDKESAAKRLAAVRAALGITGGDRDASRVSRIFVDETSMISPVKLLLHSAFSVFVVMTVIFFTL